MRCEDCGVRCQSAAAWADHLRGRMHQRRHGSHISPRASLLPELTEELFFAGLASGDFRRVIVCTGAGVSTEAGIPDFRSPGGLFELIRETFGQRFPRVRDFPEYLVSRSFVNEHPEVWAEEVEPWLRDMKWWESAKPSAAHWLCSWLHRQGWLRRVYTQNVDGLHTHPELGLPEDLVVETHGNMRKGTIVLYSDRIPARFNECCTADFPDPSLSSPDAPDLVLVLGTSLQVAPFCALPNMVPRGAARVLVNRALSHCMQNNWSRSARTCYEGGFVADSSMRVGAWKSATLRPLWKEKEGNRRWRQLCLQSECANFVQRFFASPGARARGWELPGQVD